MKMKFLFVYCLAFSFLLIQCKSDKKTSDKQASKTKDVSQDFGETGNVVFSLPSPDEIFSEIFVSEIELKPEFVNAASNASNYVDIKSQSINLGVYVSDFAYLGAIDSNVDELEYLKVIRDLMDKINLYGIVNKQMIDRINSNIMIQDSLNKISQELYYDMSELLESSNRNNILVLISTGAIIEALYLAINNIDFDHSLEVVQKIFEQKFVFDNYYEFASQYSDDIYVKTVLNELSVVKSMFDQFSYEESEIKVTEQDDNLLIIEGGKQIVVTKEAYEGFRESITNVRKLLISITKSID